MVPDPLAVTALGLAVFALPPGSKRAEPGWTRRCTADPAALAASWRPGDNVGVGCRASRIVGVDLDRHKDGGPDGCETFAALCARARAPWPATLAVRTAHGGLHLYFRAPGAPVASGIGVWPGIDIRAPGFRLGGYLAGPGSVVDGRPYAVEREAPIGDLPAWLAALLTRRARLHRQAAQQAAG